MSLRVDTASFIPGSLVCGDRGLGVFGSEIPLLGENGAGYAYNDLTLPDDLTKEICGRITSWPSSGSFYAYENTSFSFSGAPDGNYSAQYQLYVDGIATGSPTTITLQVGGAIASMSISVLSDVFIGSASSSVIASLSITSSNDAFSGLAGVGTSCLLSLTGGIDLFSGGAYVSPLAGGSISAVGDAFLATAFMSPVASVAIVSSGDAFSGTAHLAGLPVWPITSDVRYGVIFGPNGDDYTGTLVVGSGGAANVTVNQTSGGSANVTVNQTKSRSFYKGNTVFVVHETSRRIFN